MTITRGHGAQAHLAAADIGLAVGFVVMWSSGFIGAELGTRAAAALTVLAWRALIGSVILLVWRARDGGELMSRRDIAVHTAIGALGQCGYLSGVVLAVEFGVPPGTVALVAALQPLTASIAAGPILGEKVSPRQWAGLVVGLVGVAMVVSADLMVTSEAPGWAYVLPFLAMASLVAATLLDRRAAVRTSIVDGLTVQTMAAAVIFVAVSASTGSFWPPALPGFWIAIGWTVVFSHFGGYVLYWRNVRRGGVTRVGMLLYLTPGATALWALAMFGQPISDLAVAGMAVTLTSVAFGIRLGHRT